MGMITKEKDQRGILDMEIEHELNQRRRHMGFYCVNSGQNMLIYNVQNLNMVAVLYSRTLHNLI